MTNFTPLIKGQPDWHDKYNEDFLALHQKVASLAAENAALKARLDGKANIESPEIFSLTGSDLNYFKHDLAGIYSKNSFEMVYLSIDVTVKDGIDMPELALVGVLPDGFRPANIIHFVIELRSSIDGIVPGYSYVNRDDSVYVGKFRPHTETAAHLNMVNGSVHFYAVQ